jgi:hypothetical protein
VVETEQLPTHGGLVLSNLSAWSMRLRYPHEVATRLSRPLPTILPEDTRTTSRNIIVNFDWFDTFLSLSIS